MRKNILNLVGVNELTKNQQKLIIGGSSLEKENTPNINGCTNVFCPKGQSCLIVSTDPTVSGICI